MRACISVSCGCHLVQLSCSVVLYVVLSWFFLSYDFMPTVVGKEREWERGKCGQAGGRMKYL